MKVKLQNVVDEIEMQSGESAAYLNKRTGELFTLGEDESLGFDLEDDEDEGLDDDPEWLQEVRQKTREINESEDWVQLPTQHDVHEYHIMEQFAASLEMLNRVTGFSRRFAVAAGSGDSNTRLMNLVWGRIGIRLSMRNLSALRLSGWRSMALSTVGESED